MKRVIGKAFAVVAAMALVATLTGCPNLERGIDLPIPNETGEKEVIKVEAGEITWAGFDISEYTKYAKAGAKLHLSVSNRTDGGSDYCKVLILQSDWSDSGVTEAYYEGDTENKIAFELKDGDGNDVHRPYVEGEGEYYFVLNEDACSKSSLMLTGNATVKKIEIEYVGGKKEIKEPEAPAEPDLGNEDQYVKVIKLEKNEYAATAQTQVKIPAGFESVKAGDKVVVKIKGVSTKEFAAELMVVDTTEAANWWKELAEKKELTIGTEFEIDFTFDVTSAPVGTGANSVMLAINGIDGDETVKLGCTEFSITKVELVK